MKKANRVIKRIAKRVIKGANTKPEAISLLWEKKSLFSALHPKSFTRLFPGPHQYLQAMPQEKLIQSRIKHTNSLGEQPLWKGYGQPGGTRRPALVGTGMLPGRFYSQMVRELKPKTIVEFGSAFGISGMYWLAALEANNKGHLYTYEVNQEWADIAEANLEAAGKRFTLTRGLFEETVDKTLGDTKIDIAFIDGVHTSEWVTPQCELVAKRLSKNGIIILDDIAFSADMEECWSKLSNENRVKNAARLNGRVGIIQLH